MKLIKLTVVTVLLSVNTFVQAQAEGVETEAKAKIEDAKKQLKKNPNAESVHNEVIEAAKAKSDGNAEGVETENKLNKAAKSVKDKIKNKVSDMKSDGEEVVDGGEEVIENTPDVIDETAVKVKSVADYRTEMANKTITEKADAAKAYKATKVAALNSAVTKGDADVIAAKGKIEAAKLALEEGKKKMNEAEYTAKMEKIQKAEALTNALAEKVAAAKAMAM
ncbi:MAG: hypothetical protein AB8B74_07910 [Crocinitomicaceae bacterium]